MLLDILKIHYKKLLFKVPISYIENNKIFLSYLKKSLTQEYDEKELVSMMTIAEKEKFKIMQINYKGKKKEDFFYLFCVVYVKYSWNKEKKTVSLNNNNLNNGDLNSNTSTNPVIPSVKTEIELKDAKEEVIFEKKSIYNPSGKEEDISNGDIEVPIVDKIELVQDISNAALYEQADVNLGDVKGISGHNKEQKIVRKKTGVDINSTITNIEDMDLSTVEKANTMKTGKEITVNKKKKKIFGKKIGQEKVMKASKMSKSMQREVNKLKGE